MTTLTTPPQLLLTAFHRAMLAFAALYVLVLTASSLGFIPWDKLYQPDSSWSTLVHPEIGPKTVMLCGTIALVFLIFPGIGLLTNLEVVRRSVGRGAAILWGRLASFFGILGVVTTVGLWAHRGRTVGAAPPADQLVMPQNGPQLAIALFLHPADTDGIIITILTIWTVFLFSALGLVFARRLLRQSVRVLDVLSYLAAILVAVGVWVALDRMFPGEPSVSLTVQMYQRVVMISLLGVPLAYLLVCLEVGLAQWQSLRQGWREKRHIQSSLTGLSLGIWIVAVSLPVLGGLYLALAYEPPANSLIMDRNSALIDVRNPGYSALHLPAEDIPLYVLEAAESIEDPGLLRSPATHSPVNPITMVGSVTRILSDGSMTGGSGIAAQVCKLASGTPLSTRVAGLRSIPFRLVEKIFEAPCAWTLEKIAGPEKTLSLWLNMANYSCLGAYGASEVRGVGAASWVYFNKPVDQLEVHEAALLVRLPQNPCGIYAWGNTDNMVAGRNAVLRAMAERQGYLNQEEAAYYMNQPLGIPAEPMMPPSTAEPFVEQTMVELDSYGYSRFSTNGSMVLTTLDSAQQAALEDACRSVIAQQAEGGANDCGAVLLHRSPDAQGLFEVTAYVGTLYSVSGPNAMPDLVRQQPIPVGSAIKGPLYACALNHGVLKPDERLNDPGTTSIEGQRVANWDLGSWGWRPAGEMLAGSRNVPAAELVHRLTPAGFAQCLTEQFGVSTTIDHEGWSIKLGLGLAEIPLWELAISYTPMATGGYLVEPIMVSAVTNRDGERKETGGPPSPRRVISCMESAWVTESLLSVGEDHGMPEGVAVKTGTTDAASVVVAYTSDWVLAA